MDKTLDLSRSFLVATPAMEDPRFRQSVIFMCAHDDNGAMGIVVNKPKRTADGQALALTDLLGQIGVDGIPQFGDAPVLEGGPVDIDRGFVLHTSDYDTDTHSMTIGDLRLTSTRDVLDALVTDKAPERAVLAVGYAGWNGGQIEQELAQNAWIVCTPKDDETAASLLFGHGLDGKWSEALAEIGIDPAALGGLSGSA